MIRNIKNVFRIIGLLFPCSLLFGQEELRFYDPESTDSSTPTLQTAPTEPVTITVFPNKPYIRISNIFYGVNSHPSPAFVGFKNIKLIKTLRFDMIRIMVQRKTWWDNGRHDVFLSPEEGKFNWEYLDNLVEAIKSVGAEPYISFGFGGPPWLNSGGGKRFARPTGKDIEKFAKYMGQIVKHLNIDKKYKIKWFSIDNEPENVGYPIEDYAKLVKYARKYIHSVDKSVKLTGPVIGYALWEQPDGEKLSFGESLRWLYNHSVKFDGIDWHIYSYSYKIFTNTVNLVRKIYGNDVSLILSEINRDWRYRGEGGKRSMLANTSWDSACWLAGLYDILQRKNVKMVFYFCLANDFFGLLNYKQTQIRPNYYIIWFFTNILGRNRVIVNTSSDRIGCIATNDKNTILIYNPLSFDIKTTLRIADAQYKLTKLFAYTKDWFDKHYQVKDSNISLPEFISIKPCNTNQFILPAKSVMIFKYKFFQH